MAKEQEAITLGIGVQANQATVLPAVLNATALITGPATGTDATGILLRSPEDLSKAFERIESDGGRVPGSLSRASGVLSRVEPAVSFTIDLKGSSGDLTTPVAGEYDFDEYMLRLIAGARLEPESPTSSGSEYRFAATPAAAFHSLKIWRGLGNGESWTLVGCTFNLGFNFSAGEKATIDVDVIADSVIYNRGDVFPNADAAAFGNQRLAAPIVELAVSTIDGDLRPFQTGTIAVAYDEVDTQDSNVITGLIKSQGTRSIDVSIGYFEDDGFPVPPLGDFDYLENELDSGGLGPRVEFTAGILSGAGGVANAVKFLVPNFRVTGTDKIDGEQVLRTLSGYAAIAGVAGFGSAADQELSLEAV